MTAIFTNGRGKHLPTGMDPTSPNPVSNQAFTFYAANTPANKCNIKADGNDGRPLLQITDPGKQTVAPITNIFRTYATGNAGPARTQDIIAVNSASQQALAQAATARPPSPRNRLGQLQTHRHTLARRENAQARRQGHGRQGYRLGESGPFDP